MSLGGVLWSIGSRGEILSQASNYWAEPHSKDNNLIDYTSVTSNKTKVEKIQCVWRCHTLVVRVHVWLTEREMKMEQKAGNTVANLPLCGCENVCVHVKQCQAYQRFREI